MIGGGVGAVAIGILIMGALVYKATDLIKYVAVVVDRGRGAAARSEAWSGILALLLGSAAGVGIVFLMDVTSWTSGIKFGDTALVSLSFWDKVVLGLVITSLASSFFDIKKAIDGTDSASTPKLLRTADVKRRERVDAKMSKPEAVYSPRVDEKLDTVLLHENAIEEELKELLEKH
jgi:hypothetical protein